MRFLKVLLAIGLSASLVKLQSLQLHRLEQGDDSLATASQQQVKSMQLSVLSQAPTFGFDNLFANGAYLGFLQYFGDSQLRSDFGYQLSPLFFDIIVRHDPRFINAYLYLSNSVSMYLGQPERSVALMEQGLKSLTPRLPPRSYYVWRYKAIDELLFLGDGEQAKESYQTSAEWAMQSPDEEAPLIAEISGQTARFLEDNPVSRAAQISAWAQVLVAARDEQTEQIATERIESLGGTIVVNDGGQVSVDFNIYDE